MGSQQPQPIPANNSLTSLNPDVRLELVTRPVMNPDEIVDSLAHEFLLVKMKRELDQVNDPEHLRMCCLQLIDLVESQKTVFKQLLYSLIDNDPEAEEFFK